MFRAVRKVLRRARGNIKLVARGIGDRIHKRPNVEWPDFDGQWAPVPTSVDPEFNTPARPLTAYSTQDQRDRLSLRIATPPPGSPLMWQHYSSATSIIIDWEDAVRANLASPTDYARWRESHPRIVAQRSRMAQADGSDDQNENDEALSSRPSSSERSYTGPMQQLRHQGGHSDLRSAALSRNRQPSLLAASSPVNIPIGPGLRRRASPRSSEHTTSSSVIVSSTSRISPVPEQNLARMPRLQRQHAQEGLGNLVSRDGVGAEVRQADLDDAPRSHRPMQDPMLRRTHEHQSSVNEAVSASFFGSSTQHQNAPFVIGGVDDDPFVNTPSLPSSNPPGAPASPILVGRWSDDNESDFTLPSAALPVDDDEETRSDIGTEEDPRQDAIQQSSASQAMSPDSDGTPPEQRRFPPADEYWQPYMEPNFARTFARRLNRRLARAGASIEGFTSPSAVESSENLETAIEQSRDALSILASDVVAHSHNAGLAFAERDTAVAERDNLQAQIHATRHELIETQDLLRARNWELHQLRNPELFGERTTPPEFSEAPIQGHSSVMRTPSVDLTSLASPMTVAEPSNADARRSFYAQGENVPLPASDPPSFRTSPGSHAIPGDASNEVLDDGESFYEWRDR